MKRVTAFIGSARRKTTYEAMKAFEGSLKKQGELSLSMFFQAITISSFAEGARGASTKGKPTAR